MTDLFGAPDKLSLNRGQHVTILFYVCQNFLTVPPARSSRPTNRIASQIGKA